MQTQEDRNGFERDTASCDLLPGVEIMSSMKQLLNIMFLSVLAKMALKVKMHRCFLPGKKTEMGES